MTDFGLKVFFLVSQVQGWLILAIIVVQERMFYFPVLKVADTADIIHNYFD